MRISREIATDLLARATVATLLALLSINLLADFMRTGRLTGLLLLVSESMVVVFTIARRRARLVDRSVDAAVVTMLSVAGPPLLRTTDAAGLLPDGVTALMATVGLGLVIAAKFTLGRSFGIVPANRGVVVGGPYTFVRHPIYSGYLITHLGFLIAHPTPWNVMIAITADTALVVRALIEERVLCADVDYQSYCRRVGWHLVPGVF
jgi:protein-S-isoprenylcysteine O-methyltransferase Ste14